MLILIVDDEPMVRYALGRLLTNAGHTVVEAGSALDAVQILQQQDFHMAFIDYELHTALTGVDVGRHARRDTALVMITGHPASEMRPRIEDPLRGFLAIVGKPVSSAEILTIVDRIEKSLEDTQP